MNHFLNLLSNKEKALADINCFSAIIKKYICSDFFVKIVDKEGNLYTLPRPKEEKSSLVEVLTKKMSAKDERAHQNALCAYFKSLKPTPEKNS